MSYIALARKWRPRQFSEMLGQNHVTTALIHSLDQQRIHHAYLFTGTRGVGKTSVARLLAKALNCQQGITSTPCLQCDACLAVEQGRFIDLIEIDGASRTRVEDTRDLLENVQYAPTNGRYKIYLIDEVHMLSQHSFNALLKTLEEPPSHVKFILATTDPQKLPVTILSRCLQFNLKQVSEDIISSHLMYVLQQESIAYEIPALNLLAKAARGSIRDALSLLDQAIASCRETISTHAVKEMLGYTQQDYAQFILQAITLGDPHRLITLCHQINQDGGQFCYVLDEILHYLHQIAVNQILPHSDALIEESTNIQELGQQLTPEDVQLLYQIALRGSQDMAIAPSLMIGFEMTILRMYAFKPTPHQDWQPTHEHLPQTVSHDNSSSNLLFEQESYATKDHPRTADRDYSDKLPKIELQEKKEPLLEKPRSEQPPLSATEIKVFEEFSWMAILPKLQLKGLALSAVENAQIASKENGRILLWVAKAHQSLFTAPVISRIEKALADFYHEKIKVVLEYQDHVLSSAVHKKIIQEEKHKNAENSLREDPFFQQLQNEFSAELLIDSIVSSEKDS